MQITIDGQKEFVSITAAAKGIGIPWDNMLKLARTADQLFMDERQTPLVPTVWLNRLRPQATRQPISHRAIPTFSKDDLGRLIGKKALYEKMPLAFIYKHSTQSPSPPLNLAFPDSFAGRLARADKVEEAIGHGKYRKRMVDGYPRYLLSDFENGFSWASQAEKAWRRVAELLAAAAAEKTDQKDGPESDALAGQDHLKAFFQAKDKLERKQAAAHKRWKLLLQAQALPPDAGVEYDPLEAPVKKTTKFSFQPKGLRPADPADRHAYIQSLPLEFLQEARLRAHLWASRLLEDRTGYLRSHARGITPETFAADFAKTEADVTEDRLAWEAGVLSPLLGTHARFLF